MRWGFLWLTLRLIMKQRLRTITLFCGIFFSSFLLNAFGSLGYYFWTQVHEGNSDTSTFNSTELALTVLAVILLTIVLVCSAVLLHNLFAMTFFQKWHSLGRLITLGATWQQLFLMVVIEIGIIYCIAVPLGLIVTIALDKSISIPVEIPWWIICSIFCWLLIVSCICGLRPVHKAMKTPIALSRTSKSVTIHSRQDKFGKHYNSFSIFMAGKYRSANRGHYIRIVLTLITVMILYIPISYFINTDLDIQQSELLAKYGIQYNFTTQNYDELKLALEECYGLSTKNSDGDTLIYVQVDGQARLKKDVLSKSLLQVLEKAGWEEQEIWDTNCDILFLDEMHYKMILRNCSDLEIENKSAPAILVDRYINKTSYQENTDNLFYETSLVNKTIWDEKNTGVEIYCGFFEENSTVFYNSPIILSKELPEGMDFLGDVTLILPIQEIESIRDLIGEFCPVNVCGLFQEYDETLYGKLHQELGANALGHLVYQRRIFKEWYASMWEIHVTMVAVCSILLTIALVNVFSTIVFQYIDRKRGLAMLWSLGQTKQGLLRILILETARSFFLATLIGIPVSCLLCYNVYQILRSTWRIQFMLPLKQIFLLIVAMITATLVAMIVEWCCMKRQNFLQNIKDEI